MRVRHCSTFPVFVFLTAAACNADSDGGAGDGADGGSSGGTTQTGAAGSGGTMQAGGAGAGGVLGTGAVVGSGGGPGAGGAGGGGTSSGGSNAGGAGGGDGPWACPAGSENMTLDLSGKALSAPISGVPPAGLSQSFNLEGPVWIGDALYASEISTDGAPNPARIVEYVPGGGASVFVPDSGTNGLAVDRDGNIVAARQSDGTISVIDIDNPTDTPIALVRTYMSERFNSPNDLAIGSTGHIYFSDPDWQAPQPPPQGAERAYHLPPGGAATAIADTPAKPNGVTLSLDGRTLYISGFDGLMHYPVMEDGSVGMGSPVAGFSGGGDGMGMDCAGNLFVTNGTKIVVFDRMGSKYATEIEVGASVTNIAFGGPSRTTMYVTSLNPAALREVEMEIPGLPY